MMPSFSSVTLVTASSQGVLKKSAAMLVILMNVRKLFSAENLFAENCKSSGRISCQRETRHLLS